MLRPSHHRCDDGFNSCGGRVGHTPNRSQMRSGVGLAQLIAQIKSSHTVDVDTPEQLVDQWPGHTAVHRSSLHLRSDQRGQAHRRIASLTQRVEIRPRPVRLVDYFARRARRSESKPSTEPQSCSTSVTLSPRSNASHIANRWSRCSA